MAEAPATPDVQTRTHLHPPVPWHCWRCILWNAVILLWLAACGAALGAIPYDAVGFATTARTILKALIAVPIIVEVFNSPGGLREMTIKVIYGLFFWLTYYGLARTTGGWDGGWDSALVGGLVGLVLGAGLILVCWVMAGRTEGIQHSGTL